MDMQTTLLTSLRKLALQHTEDTLGDRRDYLGASDVGYCPRKVILEKIQPGGEPVCLRTGILDAGACIHHRSLP